MKIYKSADDKMVPDWVFNSKNKEYFDNETVSSKETERIINMACNISDDDIVMEKDNIEKCAKAQSTYFYNVQWPDSVKADLKEYATVCGMDMKKFQAVDPSVIKKTAIVTKEASSDKMTKTASAKLVLSDPFKLDTAGDNPHMSKADWQNVKDAVKMSEKPAMSGIVPVRGGEDYFSNPEVRIAKGQNSIADPKAIEKLFESKEEDTGARLRREKQEREDLKAGEHKEWQTANAQPKEAISRSVFTSATESLNAQPGIRGNVFDFTTVPELTDGEKLKTANEDRKRKIQGEAKEKHEFRVEKNPTPKISDTFAEELKKHLNK